MKHKTLFLVTCLSFGSLLGVKAQPSTTNLQTVVSTGFLTNYVNTAISNYLFTNGFLTSVSNGLPASQIVFASSSPGLWTNTNSFKVTVYLTSWTPNSSTNNFSINGGLIYTNLAPSNAISIHVQTNEVVGCVWTTTKPTAYWKPN